MDNDGVSRRFFLKGTLASGSAVRLSTPAILAVIESACSARDESASFEFLSQSEAREFDAIAARILPTTDTPGAREAGVIYFMDQALGSFMLDESESIRSGLARFQSAVSASFPGAELFSDLSDADQDKHLKTQDNTDFFGRVHFMTLAGFFGMSSYGGNRNQIGWKLIGFEGHRGAWQPPFGYYDAEYMRGEQDGE